MVQDIFHKKSFFGILVTMQVWSFCLRKNYAKNDEDKEDKRLKITTMKCLSSNN